MDIIVGGKGGNRMKNVLFRDSLEIEFGFVYMREENLRFKIKQNRSFSIFHQTF